MGVISGPRIPSESREEGGVLLIHSDTTDGSTSFVDSSPSGHAITAGGNVHHETDQVKFGATSLHFDGTGDYLSISDSTDWDFGTGSFTIDMWAYISSGSVSYSGLLTMNSPQVSMRLNNVGRLQFLQDAGGTRGNTNDNDATGTNLRDNAWHHLAVVRQASGAWALYVDGTSEYSGTGMSGNITGVSAIAVGRREDQIGYYLTGYLDEVRVSKGIARWTENFKPPHRRYATRDLVLSLDAMNAKSFAGEPAVNYMQWQNGYPQGWTANSENNTTNGFTRMWLYDVGSGSGYSRHCRRIRKVDGRRNVLHFALRNKTSADTRWFFPLVGIPKAEKTSAFLLTYDYKVMSNNSSGTNPQWYATSYGTSTAGGYFSDVALNDAGVGGLTDYSSSSEQAFPSAVRQVIPTSGTGVVDLGGGWYRRTMAIPANTFVESGSDGSGTGGTGVYGRFGMYTGWGSLGDYSFLMHNIQLLKGNTIGAPVALGGLGPELITNGNMETTTGTGTSGITNWTFGGSPQAGSGRSSVTSHEGTYSAAMVMDGSGSDTYFSQASVFPAGSTGKTFEITFWARVSSGASSTGGPRLYLYLDGGTYANSQYLTTSWKKCLFKFTKGSHSQASMAINRSGSCAGITFYIDQVSVKEILCARNATDGWKDISGNGNHGTFSSTDFGDSGDSDFRRHGEILLPASTDITSAPASINFDGSNDYIDLGQATDGTGGLSLKGYASLSICQWVNLDSVSSYYRTFYENQTDAGNNYRVTLLGGSSLFAFYIYTSSGTASASQGSAIATGEWTHIAGTYDGANIRLYINGEQTGSASLTGTVESSTGSYGGITIGARKSGSSLDQHVNGKIATTSVWSSGLTHAQIKQIYNAQKSRFGL